MKNVKGTGQEMLELSNGDFLTTTNCEGCDEKMLDVIHNKPENQEPITLCDKCRGEE